MGGDLRVAFFPDAYGEINGVANTSRQFEVFANKQGLPLLMVCGGAENKIQTRGSVTGITCRRGKIGFHLDKNHQFDLAFWRHFGRVAENVRRFDPDILHITGPSDVGQLGAVIAHRLRIPLAASWHTNLHLYAEERAAALLRRAPSRWRARIGSGIRKSSLLATLRFYRIAQMLFAPNPEIMDLLREKTGKPVFPMRRGVDTNLFSPMRRDRADGMFTIGYVGRLTAEKNVRLLAELEGALQRYGISNFRFSIVGQGAEERWLVEHMQKADFPGVLTGEALARTYANMDIFVFPSRSDTFGNAVLEAFASGVPAIVTDSGGPRFIVTPNETGYVAENLNDFVSYIRYVAERRDHLQKMSAAARATAHNASWHGIFESLYADYERGLRDCAAMGKNVRLRQQPTADTARLN
jgi:phosphatidylinositol alpha 1,6-mannosyltransferase